MLKEMLKSGRDMPSGTFKGLAVYAKQAAKYFSKWLMKLRLVLYVTCCMVGHANSF